MNHFNLIDKGHSYAGCHSSHVGLKERNSPGQVNPSQWEMSFLPPPRYGCWKKQQRKHPLLGEGEPEFTGFCPSWNSCHD